jgi:hypothetical protein
LTEELFNEFLAVVGERVIVNFTIVHYFYIYASAFSKEKKTVSTLVTSASAYIWLIVDIDLKVYFLALIFCLELGTASYLKTSPACFPSSSNVSTTRSQCPVA